VRNIEYAIRGVIVYAKALAKAGKIYYLNIGDPVFFDFDTPDHVKQALFEAVSIYPLNLRFCGKNVYISKGPFSRESLWRL
jgi:hypothetical protein